MSHPIDSTPAAPFPPIDPLEVVAQLPQYVGVYDREGRLRWFCNIAYPYGPQDLGRTPEERHPGADLSGWWLPFRRALLGETAPLDLTIPVRGQPGAAARFVGTMSPFRHGGGLVGVLLVCRDAAGERRPDDVLAGRFLSDDGRAVVRFLAAAGAAGGKEIGRALGRARGQTADASLRALLATMVARGVLVHSAGGYTLHPEIVPLVPIIAPERNLPS